MNYVIVYWSRYGNGKKIVDTLAKKIKEKDNDIKILRTDEANPKNMPEADIYIFSSPTEAFNIQKNMRTFLKNLTGMDGKKYGIINTHGMKRNWLAKMEKLLSKKNMVKVASVDFQIGEGSQTGNGLKEDWETKLDAFASKI